MKIFIFGAGASRDAQHRQAYHNAIPPLANELFDPRYKEFANMVGLLDPTLSTYRQKIAGFAYFEDWLTGEWDKTQSLHEVRTRDAQKGFLAQLYLVNTYKCF